MRKTNAYNKSVNCLRIYHTINCASRQERARQQHIGGGSMAERYTKTYVSVNVDIDEDGTMLPRLIRWMNGRVFAIEQLGYKCRASSAKVGGGGIRYTVRINGRETYLFQEGSRWFVEARACACRKTSFFRQSAFPHSRRTAGRARDGAAVRMSRMRRTEPDEKFLSALCGKQVSVI